MQEDYQQQRHENTDTDPGRIDVEICSQAGAYTAEFCTFAVAVEAARDI